MKLIVASSKTTQEEFMPMGRADDHLRKLTAIAEGHGTYYPISTMARCMHLSSPKSVSLARGHFRSVLPAESVSSIHHSQLVSSCNPEKGTLTAKRSLSGLFLFIVPV